MVDRFDKFTESARRVLLTAKSEAARLGSDAIGVEHLLLGLLQCGEKSPGVATLIRLNVDLQSVNRDVEAAIGQVHGNKVDPEELAITPQAKKVIELSVDEARRMNDHFIGTEHLLLALVRDDRGIAATTLYQYGIDNVEGLRLAVVGCRWDIAQEQIQANEAQRIINQSLIDRRLNDQVKQTLELAKQEALRFRHGYIGTEHLLLALVQQDSIASETLNQYGISKSKVFNGVLFIIGRGERPVIDEITPTARMNEVIRLAILEEENEMHLGYVGPEHLLLGLLREGEGVAAGVLESLGIVVGDLEQYRATIRVLVNARTDFPNYKALAQIFIGLNNQTDKQARLDEMLGHFINSAKTTLKLD